MEKSVATAFVAACLLLQVQPCKLSKEPYNLLKEHYNLSQEPCIQCKGPCILWKTSLKRLFLLPICLFRYSRIIFQKSPRIYQKSPVIHQNSPVFNAKGPTFYEKLRQNDFCCCLLPFPVLFVVLATSQCAGPKELYSTLKEPYDISKEPYICGVLWWNSFWRGNTLLFSTKGLPF